MNRKTGKLLILFLFVILIPFAVMATGCGKKVTEVKLISVNENYVVGDELKPGDFVIEVTYSDDSTEEITVTNEMLNDVLPQLNSDGPYTIRVTYGEKTYTTTITVTDPYKVDAMTIMDIREEYETYDEFVANGNIRIVYVDTTLADTTVAITADMINEMPDMTTPGIKEIQVNYNNRRLTYRINVIERTVANYEFVDVEKSYYTTNETDDVTVAGGMLVITYSNGTTETIALNDDMLFYVPEFGSEADYNVVVKVGEKDYNLVVTVTTDPEVLEYQRIVESVKSLLESSLINNADITASILLKMNSKVMGETKEINETKTTTFNVTDIEDLYFNAIVSETIKAILESTQTSQSIDHDEQSSLVALDIYDILTRMSERYLETTATFDYYTYINSNRELTVAKEKFANMIAGIINDFTFNFSRYTVEVNLETHEWTTRPNEVYYDLVDIVDTIIVKGIVQREDFREEFLEAYRDYATKVSAENPEVATACINIVDYVLNNVDDNHLLSTFIRLLDTVHEAQYNTYGYEDPYTSDAPVYANLAEIMEDYFFQTGEEEITFEATAEEFYTTITTAIEAYEDPTEIPTGFVILNYAALIMVDSRNIKPVCTAIAFEIADSILFDNIESLADNIEPANNTINLYRGYAQQYTELLENVNVEEEPDTYYYYKSQVAYYQDLADDYSKTLEEAEKSLAILTGIETSLMSVKEIIIGYVHDLAFGEEVDYFALSRDIATALEYDDIVEKINEYELAYNETGVAYILSDIVDTIDGMYGDLVEEYIGETDKTMLFACLKGIATRVDERNVAENPFNEDVIEIIAEAFEIELTGETTADREFELKNKLTYRYLNQYRMMIDMAIMSGLNEVFEVKEEVSNDVMMLVDEWIAANIEYYFNEGEEVDNLDYAHQVATMLELDDIAMLINNKIEYNTYKFAQYVVSEIRESAMEDYEILPEEIDTLLTDLNTLAEVVDTYNLYEDSEIAYADLTNALDVVMTDITVYAVKFEDVEAYIIPKVYTIVCADLEEDVMVAEIEKLVYAFEVMVATNTEFSISNYDNILVFVGTIYDAYNNGTITNEVVIKAVLDSEVMTNYAVEVLCDGLVLNEAGKTALETLFADLKTVANSTEEVDAQAIAQEYFDFATTYVNEDIAPVMYGLGVAVLVYYDCEVDYNELFKNVALPEGMDEVDYNRIIRLLVTKEELMNAIHFDFSGLNETITYTEEGAITTQELKVVLSLDFDLTFIVLDGELTLALSINY